MKTPVTVGDLKGTLRILIPLGEGLPIWIIGSNPVAHGDPQRLGYRRYGDHNVATPTGKTTHRLRMTDRHMGLE
jgi:hypothetical protein